MLSSKDIEYKVYTLGDPKVIELLLQFRFRYDENLFLEEGLSSVGDVVGEARMNEEVIVTYASLDETIKKCGFSKLQLNMLKAIGYGYTYEEIARMVNVNTSAISGRMQTIYKKITKENERQWRKSIYTNKLELKTKRCSKCRDELPATDEFYFYDKSNQSYKSTCKKCRNN